MKLDEPLRRALRVGQRLGPRTRGTWLLAYHLVGAGTRSPVDLPADGFDDQLELLASSGRCAPLAGWPYPDGARRIVLTFDDAYENFAEAVWPSLKARGLPATLFVPTGFVDGVRPAPIAETSDLPPCTWDAIRAMRAEGLEVGSHSHRHEDLRRLSDAELDRDFRLSRERIADEVGDLPRTFCYPQAKWDTRVRSVLRRHYDVGVVAGGRTALASDDPASLPRLPVRKDMGTRDLRSALQSSWWLEERLADLYRRRRDGV